MAYVPPSCDAVNFNIIGKLLTIPPCNAVNFNLVGTVDLSIISGQLVLPIKFDQFYWAQGYFVQCEDLVLKIYADDSTFQTLSEISSEDVILKLKSDIGVLRILPDCISEDLVLKTVFPISETKRSEPQDLPIKLGGGMVIPYETPIIVDEHITIPWGEGIKTDLLTDIPNGNFENIERFVSGGWKVLDFIDENTNLISKDFNIFADHSIISPWKTLLIVDESSEVKYGLKYEITNPFIIPYREPGPMDKTAKVKFDVLEDKSLTYIFPYREPGPMDRHQEVPWGPISYFGFCGSKYWPPDGCGVNFKISPKIPWTLQESALVGICSDISFDVKGYVTDLRCPYQHYRSGRRDPYGGTGGVEVKNNYFPPLKETYYMYNIVTVKRLPDNAPIEITSASIKYDKQSYTWSFTLTIGKDKSNYLDMIKPDPLNLNTFTDIEITVNNWKWVCRVESFGESRVFAKDTWTVTGRSPSMELGSPLNQKTSYTFDPSGNSLTAGAQIIDQVLEGTMLGLDNTGWTVDWSAYGSNIVTGFDPTSADHWGIKPNTFSWKDLTQIEVVKMLTDSIGAFIMTKPNCSAAIDKVLYVKPTYNVPPWHWNSSSIHEPTPDHMIRTSYATEIGRGYEMLSGYNAVYVMGQVEVDPQKTNVSSGIPVVELYRDGFGPGSRIYAPDIVDPWLTTWQACMERGRMALCETGSWWRHSIRLFSLANALEENPPISKLVLPGDYVAIEEKSTTWYGDVTSTSIDIRVESGATLIFQTIEVNEYKDN